ncbi:MAG: hypothetical protein ACYT04_28885 [Nostoc sp.]
MNTSTYIFTNNSLSALPKDLSSEEEHQILGGTKISHKPVCKSKLITKGVVLPLPPHACGCPETVSRPTVTI